MMLVRSTAHPGERLQYVRRVPPEDIALLKKFVAAGTDSVPDYEMRILHGFLLRAKRDRFWLSCDCVKSEPPPLLTVCQLGNTLYLRRVVSYGEHDLDCPFHRISKPSASVPGARSRPGATDLFGIYRDTGQSVSLPSEDRDTVASGSSRTRSLPRLGKCMFRLLDVAGLTGSPPDYKPLADQYARLRKTAEKIQIAPGIPLSNFFWTHPAQLTKASMKVKEAASQWPVQTTPHGFVLVTAERIDSGRAFCSYQKKTYEIKFRHRLYRSSGRLGESSAPFLLLLTVGQYLKTGFYDTLDGFVVPVYNRGTLIPVESAYEREVLHRCFPIMRSLRKKGVRGVRIEKPLFDIPVGEGDSCRPDFRVRSSQ